ATPENHPRWAESLAGALAITFRLVGIHFAHALEQIIDIGFVHLRRAGTFPAAARARPCRTIFLCLISHKHFNAPRSPASASRRSRAASTPELYRNSSPDANHSRIDIFERNISVRSSSSSL